MDALTFNVRIESDYGKIILHYSKGNLEAVSRKFKGRRNYKKRKSLCEAAFRIVNLREYEVEKLGILKNYVK